MLVLIRGAGDLASGVSLRLHRAGFPVVMTDLPKPTAIRRTVCLDAIVFPILEVFMNLSQIQRGITKSMRSTVQTRTGSSFLMCEVMKGMGSGIRMIMIFSASQNQSCMLLQMLSVTEIMYL